MTEEAQPTPPLTTSSTMPAATPSSSLAAASSTLEADETWWRDAAVYQIYPRSFADSNGNGIGDLPGVTERIGYLRELGIDAVWLSPFYPSALADGGYDVDDYRDVDPRLGSLTDFDEMIAALHGNGIRCIVDIVPNHTSNRHEWFVEALASPAGSPARDRYIFRDGLGDNREQAPSDWQSTFGGPAWHPAGDGQWFFHHFTVEQPDLNWNNAEVREDFLRTLRFWSDRGVDGFRIDVAHGLAKNLPEVLPNQAELDAMPIDGTHPLWDRDEVHEIYAGWRQVFNSYTPARTAVAEAWVAADRRGRYASAEGLGQAFNFDLLEADFDAVKFHDIITFNLNLASQSGSSTTWVLSNHDVVRHTTRYGLPLRTDTTVRQGGAWLLSGGTSPIVDVALGLRRARAATMLELALPGSAYLYQGEELGLPEVADIPAADRQDPAFFRNPGVDIGRDGCRVPIPWSMTGPSFGFGPGHAHLPQPASFGALSVEAQQTDPLSTLTMYRKALAIRRELRHDLRNGGGFASDDRASETVSWIETGREDVLAFSRPSGLINVTNFGSEPFEVMEGEVLLRSEATFAELPPGRGLSNRLLPGASTVWIRS